ncbi:MAG: polyribonucleotide nucleotidyltransferase [Actinobacteria bacterium]|nr:polyribonucleotide nucleotidyltransferase [Actinomycetota bacterium]MCL6104733.1 polyribonucleotide nucleotidyltransferase [Actinomycetota bacterium]
MSEYSEINKAISVSAAVGKTNRLFTFETGKLANQADGAVVARLGDTMVLVTATASKTVREGADFFPLTVDVEERMYAAGKIPGSFFRREGRATDQAILLCRLMDRPLRPCFPKDFRNEVHIVATVFGADQENPHDALAINAASAALMISDIPFGGPVGAVKIGYSAQGKWMENITYQQSNDCTFEMVVAGRAVGNSKNAGNPESLDNIAIMMVEAGGTENAWNYYMKGAPKVTEEVIGEGLEFAKIWIKEFIDLQNSLVDALEKAGGKAPRFDYPPAVDYSQELLDSVTKVGTGLINDAICITGKTERNEALDQATLQIQQMLESQFPEQTTQIAAAVTELTKQLVRKRIVEQNIRMDGRAPTDIRPLHAEVALIPTAHGSGLFERGETQVLNITTLGMSRMNQMLDTIGGDELKRYMHHYNFPPFSTGEVGFMRGPKRREIGHGLLAERALVPVIPSLDEFPYTMRLVSEVLSSNGSTSMASVCGSTLSLMDAGVPIKSPVAGIAMGLVYDDGRYITLTDILGSEDAFGDMDFKVAGTAEFVTALQLDTKIEGLPSEVLSQALAQANQARLKILDVMRQTIAEPNPEVKEYAPKIEVIQIPLDKVPDIIGPKGKTINALQMETSTEITVDTDGAVPTVSIGGKDAACVKEAHRRIEEILNPPEAKVGATYQGKVVSITKYGAFVNFLPGKDGLLHISKLDSSKRVERVEDVLSLGQDISVHVDEISPDGKVSLSLSQVALPVNPQAVDGTSTDITGDDITGDGVDNEMSGDDAVKRKAVSFEETFQTEIGEELGLAELAETTNPGRRSDSRKRKHRGGNRH